MSPPRQVETIGLDSADYQVTRFGHAGAVGGSPTSSQCCQRKLDSTDRSLNTRPRQMLDWISPSKAFADAVAFDTD
jgi:hypothetical protein